MTKEQEQLLESLSLQQQSAMGETAVLVCAIAALARTHPNPPAFATEFRRFWQQLGSPNQERPADDPAADGIAQALSVLEQACPVPLGVRPPDRAETPGS